MNSNKGFGLVGLLITVLLIAILSGGVFYGYKGGLFGGGTASSTITGPIDAAKKAKDLLEKQNQEVVKEVSTADWKTYRNEEFRVSFQYPKTVSVNSDKKSISIKPLDANPEGPYNVLYISNYCAPIGGSISPELVTVGGIKMDKYIIVPSSDYPILDYILHFKIPGSSVWNNSCNQISLNAVYGSYLRDSKDFENILATLKFE